MLSSKKSNPNIIEVKHLNMTFGDKEVIKDLSFTVKRGEVFGFLGSNGSGKTTTLRALFNIYQPTKGELLIDGQPFSEKFGGKIGYLPEERGLYKKESVLDVMVYFGELKGMTRLEAKDFATNYLKKVGLEGYIKSRISKLSGGQQQKVQLGVTIMNSPSLLILDEPTKGFDPVNRQLLMDIIMDKKKAGATIVMVSHQMEEVEALCDRILLLKNGVAKEYGYVSDIKNKYGGKNLQDIFVEIYGSSHLSGVE